MRTNEQTCAGANAAVCCISIPRARRLEMIGGERRAPGKLFGASRRVLPVKPVGTESDGSSYPPVQAAALSGLQTYKEPEISMTVRHVFQRIRGVLKSIADEDEVKRILKGHVACQSQGYTCILLVNVCSTFIRSVKLTLRFSNWNVFVGCLAYGFSDVLF